MYAQRQRLVHHIGAGVYTDTASDSNQTMFVGTDAVWAWAGGFTDTPSESIQTVLVHTDVV